MIPYIVVLIFILFLAVLFDLLGNKKNINKWINVTIVVLTLLAGFRYHIGTDSVYYEMIYSDWPTLFNLKLRHFTESDFAPLYVLFFSFLRTITKDFVLVQLVTSAIINISVIKFIQKHFGTGFIFTFILLYFCTFFYSVNCETLRESIAISVFLWSIKYLKEGRWPKYYFLSIFAFLFHYGAFLLFFLPLIRNWRFTKKSIIYIIPIIIIIPLVFLLIPLEDIVWWVISSGAVFSRFLAYMSESGMESGLSVSAIINQLVLPLFFIYYLTRKDDEEKWGNMSFMLVAYLITVWMATLIIGIFYRYNVYFGVFYYAMYAATIVDISKRYFKRIIILYILLLVPFSYTVYNNWNNVYVYELLSDMKRIDLINPYTNCFTEETIPERESLYSNLGKY